MPPGDSQKLRVLVLDEEVPWPPNSGKRIRTWNLLRRLAVRHHIHIFTYAPVSDEAHAALRDHGLHVTLVRALPPSRGPLFGGRLLRNVFSKYPYSVAKHFTSRLQDQVNKACCEKQFDLAHIEWIPYARYATPGLHRLVTAHNVESDIWRRRAHHTHGPIGRWFFGLQARRMEVFERHTAARANSVVTVSELDAQRFRSYGAQTVKVVPNGVDLDYFQPMPKNSKSDSSLLFVGSLDWYPNEDAVRDFASRVFPVIRSRNEKITFRIVGRKQSASLANAVRGMPGVELIGEVPDVRPYVAEAGVVVVPLRIGGGTRIKILEALAMHKPVVSTSIGAEGLGLKDGYDLLIADTPEQFATGIESLLANPQLQEQLGRNGRSTVEKLYAWDLVAAKLEQAWWEASEPQQAAAANELAVAGVRR